MAKLGPKAQSYDPFSKKGKKSEGPGFGALEEALESLDAAPRPEDSEDKDTPASSPGAVSRVSGGERSKKKAASRQANSRSATKNTTAAVGVSAQAPAERGVAIAPRLDMTKRVKMTREEAARLDAASMRLASSLGIRVDFSKISRALWDIYLRHEEDILRNVSEDEQWHRPANSEAAKLAELDEKIAKLINDGFMVACRRPSSSD